MLKADVEASARARSSAGQSIGLRSRCSHAETRFWANGIQGQTRRVYLGLLSCGLTPAAARRAIREARTAGRAVVS